MKPLISAWKKSALWFPRDLRSRTTVDVTIFKTNFLTADSTGFKLTPPLCNHFTGTTNDRTVASKIIPSPKSISNSTPSCYRGENFSV